MSLPRPNHALQRTAPAVTLADPPDRRLSISPVKRGIITICLFAMALLWCPLRAADPATAPFQSVLVRHDTIVATLPAAGTRWFIESGSSPKRVSEHGEAFTLHTGTSMRLSEKHSTYLVTVQLKPTPGLQVVSTFDAGSFGGTVTSENYFIPAR